MLSLLPSFAWKTEPASEATSCASLELHPWPPHRLQLSICDGIILFHVEEQGGLFTQHTQVFQLEKKNLFIITGSFCVLFHTLMIEKNHRLSATTTYLFLIYKTEFIIHLMDGMSNCWGIFPSVPGRPERCLSCTCTEINSTRCFFLH